MTRCSIVTTEIRTSIAAEASLRLQVLAHTVVGVTNKHAKTLPCVSRSLDRLTSTTYGFEGSHFAFARRNIIDDKATLGLARVLVIK